jgi:hypothetical protein
MSALPGRGDRLDAPCRPRPASLDLCEHPFVTSQGSAYARFRRALERGNVTEALSAARELQHVGLADALGLCLLLRDKAPEKYGRAALRWHGRYCRSFEMWALRKLRQC